MPFVDSSFQTPRARAYRTQMTHAVEQELRTLGARHLTHSARTPADEQQLRPLVLAALQVGIPIARILQLTGLTPAVVERWSGRDAQPTAQS